MARAAWSMEHFLGSAWRLGEGLCQDTPGFDRLVGWLAGLFIGRCTHVWDGGWEEWRLPRFAGSKSVELMARG